MKIEGDDEFRLRKGKAWETAWEGLEWLAQRDQQQSSISNLFHRCFLISLVVIPSLVSDRSRNPRGFGGGSDSGRKGFKGREEN